MTDEDRKAITWSVRYIDRGTRDDAGYIIPMGWYVIGWEEGEEDSLASIYIAQHTAGTYAAASLAAVTSHLLNTFEKDRITAKGEGS
jgi:hypothetical protein